jgi:hypothetical protein
MKTNTMLMGVFFTLLISASAMAISTEITVHVKTKDAKFLGTSM